MYYMLIYRTIKDYVEKRAPFREEHLGYSRASQARGELFMGGVLGEPVDTAILIFRTDSPALVDSFARDDPYVKAGLIESWTVRPWTVAIGG